MTQQPRTTAQNKKAARLALGLIAGATLTGTAATTASADPYAAYDTPQYIAADREFREDHPMRVYVDIDSRLRDRDSHRDNHRGPRGNRGRDRTNPLEARTLYGLNVQLPDYVRMVDSPRHADLVIRVREVDFDMDFRVVDVDRKDKKYKKSRRFAGGRCGIHHKAYYTRIKEKGEAYARYNMKVNLKGVDFDRDQIAVRAAETYSYGQDLRAKTNCGMRPTNQMPSNGVAELFERSHEGYRQHVARKIRKEAADNLGRKLAYEIHQQANQYYADLATRLAYGPERPYRFEESYYGSRRDRDEEPRLGVYIGENGFGIFAKSSR